jgi:hypothetical protein
MISGEPDHGAEALEPGSRAAIPACPLGFEDLPKLLRYSKAEPGDNRQASRSDQMPRRRLPSWADLANLRLEGEDQL